jgi:AhpD family alkylhydroperoxidase
MRLAILDQGHSFGTKVLFAIIRAVSRQPVLDVIKLVKYRPDFYCAQRLTHEAMRGPSAWSVGDRELMAAYVAKSNECEWCTRAHAAVAERSYCSVPEVTGALADLDTAPIQETLRATLRMLRKLALEHTVSQDDIRAVLAAGVSCEQIKDALAVFFAFSMTTRLANAFGFTLATPEAFEAGAKYLLSRGYR